MKFYSYGGCWVGLHPGSNRLICLNDTAYTVWTAYSEGLPTKIIAEQIAKSQGVEQASVDMDVGQIVKAIEDLDKDSTANKNFKPITGWSPAQSIPIPQDEVKGNTTFYRLGISLIAVQADKSIIRTLRDQLIGHLSVRSKTHVHMLIKLRKEKEQFLIDLGEERIWVASEDELFEKLLFCLLEVSYRVPPTIATLHAGAVVKNDSVFLIIGEQGRGKSTLIASLASRGMGYLSDDISPLDNEGKLIPIPAPQSIKTGSFLALRKDYPEISGLPVYKRLERDVRYLKPNLENTEKWGQRWEVGALIFPYYGNHAKPKIEALNDLEKLQELATSNSLLGDNDLSALLQWLKSKPAYRVSYSNAHTVDALLEKFIVD